MSKNLNVVVCQINPTLGDFEGNQNLILENYSDAIKKGADIVVFPEMAVCGYPPQDLLNNKGFVDANLDAIKNISKKTSVPCIIGYVNRVDSKIFNAAAICYHGSIKHIYHKIHLPNYDVFDEQRYFTSGKDIGLFSINVKEKEIKLGLQICEDLWDDVYDRKISAELLELKPEIIINISASPYAQNRFEDRKSLIERKFKNVNCPFVYCNTVGGQDELIFDGNSMIFDKDMMIIEKGKSFSEDLIISDCKTKSKIEKKSNENEIYDALVLGIKDYFKKTGHLKAVIGLSGGIDSALVSCLAVDALGSENVHLISMPSRFSSDHSKDDAIKLAKNLNANFEMINIDGLFQNYLDTLKDTFKGTSPNVAEENIQSRIRGNILMAISNKFGSLVLSTGNKTELGLGYCTLYGDMSGGLSAIGDLNKKEVYNLSKWKNRNNEIIPKNIINKKPSAELAPKQYDPFDYDKISPVVDDIILGSNVPVENIDLVKKVNINEHKRRQAAPVLRVSKKAFGIGRRIPIVNHFND